MTPLQFDNCRKAAERFFRLYQEHAISPSEDTLFNFLNAAHSLNDRFKASANRDFFELDEFIALKAIRNLFHHKQELLNQVKTIQISERMPITCDLIQMCLVPEDLALQAVKEERREDNRPRVQKALKWYGSVVDINPAIFNFAVHVYEETRNLELLISGDAVENFAYSYQHEEAQGYSHFVDGEISCHAGNVKEVLKSIYIDAPKTD